MELSWIWKSILIVVAGTLLLRLAGRRSISQMTVSQTVVMISIGTLLIQPVSGKNMWVTIGVALILVATLQFSEYIQLKFNPMETFITGKALVVIENGTINEKNLKKLKLTVDKLEMRLRQSNISNFNHVKYATIEPNGQLGLILKEQYQPATKGDIQTILQLIETKFPYPQTQTSTILSKGIEQNIFNEVIEKVDQHHPKHLQ